jgi:GAF domain-containing protein
MYYPEPRTPLSSDFELINAAGHIALIAIELDRSQRALKNALVEIKNSENRLRTIIDTIPALAWSARPPVDREGGPCTEAARRKTQVIVSDIASDTRWDTYGWRTAALAHGLKACWSTTILASNGLVLGAFAIYWREPRSPTEQDKEIIEQVPGVQSRRVKRDALRDAPAESH